MPLSKGRPTQPQLDAASDELGTAQSRKKEAHSKTDAYTFYITVKDEKCVG